MIIRPSNDGMTNTRHLLTGAWLCPWHHCSICGRSSTHQCSQCPNAFCLHHFPHHLSYLNNGSPICTSHPEAPPICPDQVNAILTEMAEVKEGLINKEGSLTHGSKDRNSVKEKDDKKGAKDQNKKKRLKSSSEEEDEEDEGAYECRESDKKKKNNKESPVKVDRYLFKIIFFFDFHFNKIYLISTEKKIKET